jgi:drug/metabolite transporter (DMT)-like permease
LHLAIIPIVWEIDLDAKIVIISFVVGVGMSLGYLLFMRSLMLEELSRVTILGYIHPIFVVLLAYLLLNESLILLDYLAIAMLTASATLISYRDKGIKISKALIPMLGLNVALAVESIVAKYLLTFTDYWSYIFWFMLGLISVRLSFLIDNRLRNRFKVIRFDKSIIVYGFSISILFLLANLTFYYALSLQLVSIIVAVSATQPIAILIMIYITNRVRGNFIDEDTSYKVLIFKIISSVLVVLGIYILAI